MIGRLIVALIRLYQVTVSPLFGSRCRFHPSCSDYAAQAVVTHGVTRGVPLALWRVIRCGPWTRGGLDPVPNRRERLGVGIG